MATSTLLNSMGAMTFHDVRQITLPRHLARAREMMLTTVNPVLLLEGGIDISPALYGERNRHSHFSDARDQWEVSLIEIAVEQDIPIVGICRGHQLLAAHRGGKLYQDLYRDAGRGHDAMHYITCRSALRELWGAQHHVNSYHHQAVKRVPAHAVEIAVAPDGTNEGLLYQDIRAVTVQWHPEFMNDYAWLDWALGQMQMPSAQRAIVEVLR